MIVLVAPFAGAWIEIHNYPARGLSGLMSLPSRERGLKYVQSHNLPRQQSSLPSRERGLKLAG